MTIATVNPFTNKTVKTFPGDTPDKIEEAIAAADAEFARWKRTSYEERAGLLRKVATICVSERRTSRRSSPRRWAS